MTDRELMQQALEAFGEIAWSNNSQWQADRAKVAITALRAALAEQPAEQSAEHGEPVAWMYDWEAEGEVVRDWLTSDCDEAHSPTMGCHNIRPLYTAPQPAKPAEQEPEGNVCGRCGGLVFDPVIPQKQQEPVAWQLIETAPKTGRKVILFYLNRNNFPRTVMARWLTDDEAAETDTDCVGLEGGWYECIDNWNDYTEVAIHEGEPTHWMPLPPAPTAEVKPDAA